MGEVEPHGGPTRLGSYEIVRPLARGGMAELFLARVAGPQSFEKLVVIKKILPKYADNPRFVQLFDDEARLAASLSHKNIVAVHDVGGSGAEHFFAMEYLHGQDVRSILHRAWVVGEKLPIPHAVQIASQVASALHYAHEKRRSDGSLMEIVHRDVSPSNVIVSYDGAVKLVDFGVAKAATRTVKTRTGTLKGKIAYMSPEQAKGASIDRRSDVFSLGIVLWEMVTTTRLFRGDNDLATLQLIINQPIKRPTEERPDCPPELERIVLKALAQDATRRYQTAQDLAQDLEELVRVEQLSQSAAGLSVYMSTLFRPELDSWEQARADGVPLGEHLTSVGDMTTPVSESEFIEAIDLDADEEDEEDDPDALEEVAGTIEPVSPATVPGRRASTPPAGTPRPPVLPSTGSGPVRASAPSLMQITGNEPTEISPGPPQPPPGMIATGAPRGDATEHVAPLPAPTGVRGDVTPLPLRASHDAGSPWPNAPTPHGGLAHGSWPQQAQTVAPGDPDALPFSLEQAQRLKKQFTYVAGGLLALVVIIAIAKGGGGGEQAAAGDQQAADGSVRAEPAPPPAPIAAPPVDAGVAPSAVPVDAPVVEPSPPPEVTKPAVKKPPVKKPPVKKPPTPKFDPNAPIAPR